MLEEQGDGLPAEDECEGASGDRHQRGQGDGFIDQAQRLAQTEEAAQTGDLRQQGVRDRIDEQRHDLCRGNQLVQNLQVLWHHLIA